MGHFVTDAWFTIYSHIFLIWIPNYFNLKNYVWWACSWYAVGLCSCEWKNLWDWLSCWATQNFPSLFVVLKFLYWGNTGISVEICHLMSHHSPLLVTACPLSYSAVHLMQSVCYKILSALLSALLLMSSRDTRKGKNPYKMTRTSNILLNSSYVTEADLLEIYRANTCNPCTWANSRESAFPWTGQACQAGTGQKLVWKSPVVSVNGWPRVAGYLCYISVLMFLFVCLFIQHNRRQGIKSCSHPSSFPSLFPSASSS